MQVLTSTSDREWHTPPWLLGMVHDVLGEIDLDPASSAVANERVKANRYFSVDDDGLAKPWEAMTVFLNPPYNGSSTIWSSRMIEEYTVHNFEEGILLVFAKLGYNWFNRLFYARHTCILRERVEFIRPDGSTVGKAKHASALVYFGLRTGHFADVFWDVGRVISPA